MMIDPGAITLVQSSFFQQLTSVLKTVSGYAIDLLYIFAALEIAIFGLAWALKQEVNFGDILFKIIKIGLIFFIIANYAYFQDIIIKSFAQIGGATVHIKHLDKVIFNPAQIWQYGYDTGLALLKSTVLNNLGLGLSLIQIILGFGILLVFGLFGIQILLQLIGFYLVTLTALVFMPLGVFNPSLNMFDNAVSSVLKAGTRVMVILIVVGVAVTIWHGFNLVNISDDNLNINQILGLFFTGLTFLFAAIKLPKIASDAVGKIRSGTAKAPTVNVSATAAASPNALPGGMVAMQAATQIEAHAIQPNVGVGSPAQSVSTSPSVTVSAVQPQFAAPLTTTAFEKRGRVGVADGSAVQKSISDNTLKQLKQTIRKTLQENK